MLFLTNTFLGYILGGIILLVVIIVCSIIHNRLIKT